MDGERALQNNGNRLKFKILLAGDKVGIRVEKLTINVRSWDIPEHNTV